MSLQVIQYPHPTLRHRSKPLKRVDADLRKYVDEMIELMYEHGQMLADWFGERHAMHNFRKHASWYNKGFRIPSETMRRIDEEAGKRQQKRADFVERVFMTAFDLVSPQAATQR